MQRDLHQRRTAVLLAQSVVAPGVLVHKERRIPQYGLYVVNHILSYLCQSVSSHSEIAMSENEWPPAAEDKLHNG